MWFYSGDASRTDVNQMFLQPFASYQATRTITLTLQSEMTANWNADEDDSTWTIPINFIMSKLSSFDAFPVHPDVGPSWKVRAAIVLLLPRSR